MTQIPIKFAVLVHLWHLDLCTCMQLLCVLNLISWLAD